MKSYMTLCEDCDRVQQFPDTLFRFYIQGYDGIYGYITEQVMQKLSWDTKHWKVDDKQKTVELLGDCFNARRDALDQIVNDARERENFNVLKRWTEERLPIYGPRRELLADIERAAATLFGVVTYGVELIVYREDPEGLVVWLARRAATKTLYPNKLGVTVGGTLPSGETPFECLVRESYEEANLSVDLVSNAAKPVGTMNYVFVSETKTTSGGEAGLIRPEVQYIYDMKVGPDVVPAPCDKEASEINLYSIDDIKKAMDESDFTPANACFMVDFFIRHGVITYENEMNYNQIITRLHRPLGMPTA